MLGFMRTEVLGVGWVGGGKDCPPLCGERSSAKSWEIALSRLFKVELGKEWGQEKEQKEHSRQ